jgi:Druantia protein DruA
MTIRVQGRDLTEADLAEIRRVRAEHPEWSRFQLSVFVAERWQWRNGAGRLKDMAARTLLLKLQERGLIALPPPLRRNGRRRAQTPPPSSAELFSDAPERIATALDSLRPVSLELVENLKQRRHVHQLLQRYHYRGYSGAVGENVQYLARDGRGRELAVMIFGAAAWKVAARDQFIGWSDRQRVQRLGWLANQQRFLILPWVRVLHLASHLLALATQRLSRDWQSRYGHPIWLVETFVERERFAATSYKAAGWTQVGQTTGRTRQDCHRTIQTPLKSVWLRPLHPGFRTELTAP